MEFLRTQMQRKNLAEKFVEHRYINMYLFFKTHGKEKLKHFLSQYNQAYKKFKPFISYFASTILLRAWPNFQKGQFCYNRAVFSRL